MSSVLTFNVGSSSLKIAYYQQQQRVFSLNVDIKQQHASCTGQLPSSLVNWQPMGVLSDDACYVAQALYQQYQVLPLVAHRVVHGGHYQQPVIINPETLAQLQQLAPLCPLHQAPALAVIEALAARLPALIQIAAFDTSFHSQQPALSFCYALPLTLRNEGIRAYGFHGLSCQSIMRQLLTLNSKMAKSKLIIAHLGNGASITAVLDGISQANSMGFSTLEGVPMGTRCGHLDAGILLYLLDKGWTTPKLNQLLYKESGLLGLSGISSDMRELTQDASPQAQFSIDYFCRRVAQEISSLATAIGGIETLVFTGGIGEHQAIVRAKIASYLTWLGLELDTAANLQNKQIISESNSRIATWVLASNEQHELYLAAQLFNKP